MNEGCWVDMDGKAQPLRETAGLMILIAFSELRSYEQGKKTNITSDL